MDTTTVYQTLGIVRRTDALDAQGRFALVHPVAACCATGIALGLCVRGKGASAFKNGMQVIVRGQVSRLLRRDFWSTTSGTLSG